MVLEHLLPEEWLERKSYYAFFLGAGYSVVGIVLARLLFAADPALPAVAFTSLLLLPELYRIFAIEEKQQSREKSYGLRLFWRDTGDFYRVFLFLFLGILIVYSFAALVLPAFSVNALFREQIELRGSEFSAVGAAVDFGGSDIFWRLFTNNAIVLAAVFVVALLAGDGAVFLIVWNASVWGTIFGITARNAAYVMQSNQFFYFLTVFLIVLPHVLLEATAYILAAMAGGLISKGALRENISGQRFSKVFKENAFILVLAIICLVLGVLVESFVLTNSDRYSEIIRLSMLR